VDIDEDINPVVFVGLSGNHRIAEKVASHLQVPLLAHSAKQFADGEVNFQLANSIRGHDVYIFQSMCQPVHDNIMECLFAITACRRASANSITVIAPYLAYSRVDRLLKMGTTIAAADVLKLVETAGCDYLLTVDVHRRSAEGFTHVGVDFQSGEGYETPCMFDSLESLRLSIPVVLTLNLFNPVIVCPSSTGVTRAKKYMELLRQEGVWSQLAFISPTDRSGAVQDEDAICHHKTHVADRHILVGDVANSDVLIIDDMIDTGSRVAMAAEVCKRNGAKRVFAYATHGIFSGDAVQKLEDSPLDEIFVTDTIPAHPDTYGPQSKISYLEISPLLAEAIRRKVIGMSLQTLTHL